MDFFFESIFDHNFNIFCEDLSYFLDCFLNVFGDDFLLNGYQFLVLIFNTCCDDFFFKHQDESLAAETRTS